jgi:hypothetical protein
VYVVSGGTVIPGGTSENSCHHLPTRFLRDTFADHHEWLLSALSLVCYSALAAPNLPSIASDGSEVRQKRSPVASNYWVRYS